MTQSLAIPRVIPNDWKRLDLIVNKIKFHLGSAANPTFAGVTVTGLTASTIVGVNADKALESITVGTGLDYTRPNLTLSHLGIEALTDPGADKILFWDDSASACKWLGVGNSIAITATTIDTIQDIRTTATPTFYGLDLSYNLNIITNSGATARIYQMKNNAYGASFQLLKARGVHGGEIIVNNGDEIGRFETYGHDGSGWQDLAQFRFFVDGPPATGVMPGRIVFYTCPSDGVTPTERVRINSSGNLGLGQTSFGANMAKGLAIGTGVAPTASPVDAIQLYSADFGGGAGLACPHFRNENGTVVRLNQDVSTLGTPTFVSLDLTGTLTVDTINEHTGAAGVTIEGILIKDSDIHLQDYDAVFFGDAQDAYIYFDTTRLLINSISEVWIGTTYDKALVAGNLFSNGNMNIGYTAMRHTWKDYYDVLEIGGTGALFCNTSVLASMSIGISQNAYFDETDERWEYAVADEASVYIQNVGRHIFYVNDGAGAAIGGAIAWSCGLIVEKDATVVCEGTSVTIGKASTTTGTLVLHDSNSANTITLTVPDISAGSLVFTLPATDGDNTNVLQTNGNGVLSWVAAGGGAGFDIDALDVLAAASIDSTVDYYAIYDDSAAVNKKVLVPGILKIEISDRTVNVDNSMSTAEVQAAIDSIGKFIMPGVVITFQFADGTYTLTDTLYFGGFVGGGQLNIYGNTGDGAIEYTAQSVFLDFDGQTCDGLTISGNLCTIWVYNLKIEVDTASNYSCIYSFSTGWLQTRYNYLLGDGTAGGSGLYCYSTACQILYTYVSNMKYGIQARYSQIQSHTNDDTGTMPAYGLYSANASVIHKVTGTNQPDGSSADEYVQGGEIWAG